VCVCVCVRVCVCVCVCMSGCLVVWLSGCLPGNTNCLCADLNHGAVVDEHTARQPASQIRHIHTHIHTHTHTHTHTHLHHGAVAHRLGEEVAEASLFTYCLSGVTLVLHGVTVVLRWCYNGVTVGRK
jgi:hypothetical protein